MKVLESAQMPKIASNGSLKQAIHPRERERIARPELGSLGKEMNYSANCSVAQHLLTKTCFINSVQIDVAATKRMSSDVRGHCSEKNCTSG